MNTLYDKEKGKSRGEREIWGRSKLYTYIHMKWNNTLETRHGYSWPTSRNRGHQICVFKCLTPATVTRDKPRSRKINHDYGSSATVTGGSHGYLTISTDIWKKPTLLQDVSHGYDGHGYETLIFRNRYPWPVAGVFFPMYRRPIILALTAVLTYVNRLAANIGVLEIKEM